jgi:hypothetical protein
MEPTTKKYAAIDLADASLTRYQPQFSYGSALTRGAIVDVTSWLSPECHFGRPGVAVRVAVTARLWNLMVKTCVELRYCEALYGKDHDVLHLAAHALERARRLGLDAANFQAYLAGAGKTNGPEQTIRVEYQEVNESRGYVVIGSPDEIASL